jgi:hypothetical protein
MTDINQTNNKERQISNSEFENLLQVYTEHTLKADSSLPPQTRVVAESLTGVQKVLEAKDIQLDERVSFVENKFSELNTNLTNKVDNNLNAIITSIDTEVNRAKIEEKLLSNRILDEKNRLDLFFENADRSEAAIDNLKEIQD